ncbi:MAG: hypothetical protein C4K48_04130 [Candidatus Thorarchaeota archaeon]|nr:MAG: hypothetical protein C4K48_04130 [Candidatus Thorarchaeota archaeon]
MKSNNEDDAPSAEPSKDAEKEPFDLEDEIKKKSGKKHGHKKPTLKAYASMVSFIVWMAFLILWLFFFAGNYGIFENIAVVIVALLVVVALNALLWIPSDREGIKAKTSAVGALIWLVFLAIWIIFFSAGFGIYENIGIALASLLIVGAFNVLLWVPGHGDAWGARVSAIGGIGWLTFIVLFIPFANDLGLDAYHAVAVILTSFLLMVGVVALPWRKEMRIEVDAGEGAEKRVKLSIVGFILWVVFIIIWMWFFAGMFSGNQNVGTILLSFVIFGLAALGLWLPWARVRGEGPESWFSISIGFAWLVVLTLWFWFFADSFNAYQNFAVFLISLLIVAAIAGAAQWKKLQDFEVLDWKD